MSSPIDFKIACPHCKSSHTIKVYQSINVLENPELKEKIKDGSLFTWTCPLCGTTELIRNQVLYHDPLEKQMYWMTQGMIELEERLKALRIEEGLESYSLRIVDSVGELIEKVKIHDAGLDDMVIEMCKYVTKLEIGTESPMKFLKMDGADGDITLTYPKDKDMEMVVIGFNVYEDCRSILGRNPRLKEESTGFVHIDSQWINKYFQ